MKAGGCSLVEVSRSAVPASCRLDSAIEASSQRREDARHGVFVALPVQRPRVAQASVVGSIRVRDPRQECRHAIAVLRTTDAGEVVTEQERWPLVELAFAVDRPRLRLLHRERVGSNSRAPAAGSS
jgi:hypothetical protein